MAGKLPERINFGPYSLKTYSPKKAFKAQFPLRPDQHCLIDNLWNLSKTSQFFDILHALVGHIANLNSQIEYFQHQQIVETIPLAPQWKGKEKMLEAQDRSKSNKILALEEELQVYKKKIAEGELMKDQWEKELNNKMEHYEVFPEELNEVKETIRSIVVRDTKRKLLATQACLRSMAKSRQVPHVGLALKLINFQGNKHPQQYCRCPEGFSFIQASLNLGIWHDVDFFLSFENLFRSGMLNRVIITAPRQVVKYIEPISWHLAHILYQLYKLNLAQHGYINLEMDSTPSSLNFPDDARHCILITTHEFLRPLQQKLLGDISIIEGDVETHYLMARTFFQAMRPLKIKPMRYDYRLISEDRNLKIYGDLMLGKKWVDMPFLNHITEDIKLMVHYQTMDTLQCYKSYGDSEDLYEACDAIYNPSDVPFNMGEGPMSSIDTVDM